MKRKLWYLWHFYIWPVLKAVNPNSPAGADLREEKIGEDLKELDK